MTKKIFILLDYRDTFYSSVKEVAGSMDILRVKNLFEEMGYQVEVERFSNINFRSAKYSGSFVLYQSSEDPNLYYKDYIEDIILGLKIKGAILIPDFFKFRAHHNKVFMEILRDTSGFDLIQNIETGKYGTTAELINSFQEYCQPLVVKPGFGSKGFGIKLAQSRNEVLKISRKISRSYSLFNFKRFIYGIFNGKGFKPISNHRKKFITQNFIDGLSFDYKILVYGEKFYVLKRKNRPGDFRASGSGLLSFPKEVSSDLLDYAEKIFTFFNAPFISIDVGVRDNEFFLLEFQFLSFGNYALEHSSFFYKRENSQWLKVNEISRLEEVFTDAIDIHIKKHWKNLQNYEI